MQREELIQLERDYREVLLGTVDENGGDLDLE